MKKLTKRQKICGVVLVLVAGVLVVDRVFLASEGHSPQRASAEAAPQPTNRPPVDVPPAPSMPPAPAQGDGLADRLEALAESRELDLAEMRDAFALSRSWAQKGLGSGGADARLSPAEQFTRDYKLKAVMVAGRKGAAQVNGVCVTVGQSIGAFRLVGVTERSAVFASGDQRVVLKLKNQQ